MLKSKANWKWSEISHSTSIMEQLLHERGLETDEEKESFLHPKLEHIQSPADLSDIKKAKMRIFRAMENEEKVLVYGDYDADGVTSTTLLMTAFMELGVRADYYIPDRFKEGYGLNEAAIRSFHDAGYTVIVTVDNGIANVQEVDVANQLGMDVIITDHHEVQETLPDAYAIIHPKLSESYQFKELAGVGVAFQFAHYLLDYFPAELLDLVAIGTVADLVPLQGENRVFAYFGIQNLSDTLHIGLQALKEGCNLSDEITAQDIGFKLGPRLNAVGRLENAMLAVELLLTDDEEVAKEIALEVEALNSERQQIVNQMVKEAEKRVDTTDDVIILYDENWHEGVLGVVASRLVRTFDRPVIMLCHKTDTNELKGSARSIPAFNLFENGMKVQHLFTNFGGHSQAAGLTFPFENLDEIKERLNEQIRDQLTREQMKQEIMITKEISLEEMTERLVEQISDFAPFGMGNEEPVFLLKAIPSQIRQIGQQQNHLKLQFKHKDQIVDAIGFQFGYLASFLAEQTEIELVGTLQINEWNGNKTVQMLLKDVAVNEWQLFDYRGRKQSKFFTPYLTHYQTHTFLGNDIQEMKSFVGPEEATFITYETDMELLEKTDMLYIYDLPEDITDLEQVVTKLQPSNIHISYYVEDSAFFQTMPTREEFKWLYGYAMKYGPIQLKVDLQQISNIKKWSREKVIFMLKVFLDLQFITIKDDVLYINNHAEKQALDQSKTYQNQLNQSKIEQTLYYATYDEIKQWLHPFIRVTEANEEEVFHGL